MSEKNLYQILEVSPGASVEDIKKSYRKLALKLHPDKNNNSDSLDFLELTDAYNILLDKEKRSIYDKIILKPEKTYTIKKGSDLRIVLNVESKELVSNSKKSISIKRYGFCDQCNGTGSLVNSIIKCSDCDGSGLQDFMLVMGFKKRCNKCSGLGILPVAPFYLKCRGSSVQSETVNYDVKLNPLTEHYVIPNLGNYGPYKGDPGNLIIDLIIKEDPIYKLRGIHIEGQLNLSPVQAILGGTLKLNVLGKVVNIKIPSGTQHNDQIKVDGEGSYYEGKYGDLKVLVKINIPNIITEKEGQLYEQLFKFEKEFISWPTVLKI